MLNGSGSVVNGDTLKVHNDSSASNSTVTMVTPTIGSTAQTFTVTTKSLAPTLWQPSNLGAKLPMRVAPDGMSWANGSNIATWADKSGNAKNLTGTGSG